MNLPRLVTLCLALTMGILLTAADSPPKELQAKYSAPKKALHHKVYKHWSSSAKANPHHHYKKAAKPDSGTPAHHDEVVRHTKATWQHAPHSVSHHDARLQSDVTTSRKAVRDHDHAWARADLHLQDIALHDQPSHHRPRVAHVHSQPAVRQRPQRQRDHSKLRDIRGPAERTDEPRMHVLRPARPLLRSSVHHRPIPPALGKHHEEKAAHGRKQLKSKPKKAKKATEKKRYGKKYAKEHLKW